MTDSDDTTESGGTQYIHLDELPDTTKRLITLTILEDLSDSQLIGTIQSGELTPSQYLPAIATLTQVLSTLINHLSAAHVEHQKYLREFVEDVCETSGIESPFTPKEFNDEDVKSTIENLTEFLNRNTDK